MGKKHRKTYKTGKKNIEKKTCQLSSHIKPFISSYPHLFMVAVGDQHRYLHLRWANRSEVGELPSEDWPGRIFWLSQAKCQGNIIRYMRSSIKWAYRNSWMGNPI